MCHFTAVLNWVFLEGTREPICRAFTEFTEQTAWALNKGADSVSVPGLSRGSVGATVSAHVRPSPRPASPEQTRLVRAQKLN